MPSRCWSRVGGWLLIATAGGVLLGGCGGHSRSGEAVAGQPGGGLPAGGGGTPATGGSAAEADGGELAGSPPAPVDPAVSQAWTWQPCGTLEPEGADRAALFDGSGRIVVLGPRQVRVHEAGGALDESASGAAADFLVVDPDGAVLTGQATPAGVRLTAVGESTPRFVLPSAPVPDCGSHFALSADGAYLLASGTDIACAWRMADATFAGSISGEQVTIRASAFVSIEQAPSGMDLVRRDFTAHELSRRSLGQGPVVLSPAGDRAVVDGRLVNAETGDVVAWDVEPAPSPGVPLFSPRGEVVLVGDGIYDAQAGVRRFGVPRLGRLATTFGDWRVLAGDGKHALASAEGRATLFDVEALGVSAVLGRPPLPNTDSRRRTSDLAISRDGSLLVHNVEAFATFGIRVAPSFGDSQVLWGAHVELNLAVDVSNDGHFVAVGGDGRAIYDARDGHAVWPSAPPPAAVDIDDICLLDRLRFSPQATWIAGSSYSDELQVFRFDGGSSGDPWVSGGELPGHCDAPAFSRNGRLLATSAAALYETSASHTDWKQVWSSPVAPAAAGEYGGYASNDADFSPDETQLLVSRCWMAGRCTTLLLSVATGAVVRSIPELEGPHPSFSPEGSWLVAANKLLHLPSGEVRDLSADADPTSPAVFTPEGDIIAGSANGTLTRYCRH